jgi:hypothetical protein
MTAKRDPSTFKKIRPWHERFFSRVTFDGSSCWLWTGAVNRKGYGMFNAGRALDGEPALPVTRRVAHLAHRVAYTVARGEPTGECLMHSCDRPACVNPWHLTDATLAENNRDMYAKGRGLDRAAASVRMRELRAARGAKWRLECR